MNAAKPLISVIIPVYNCEKYISDAIDSVMAQNYQNLEIIVIDDGSTDNTANIVKNRNSTKYIFQQNAGPASARNKGICSASGELIAFIDSDDLWPENKLGMQLIEFQDDKDSEVIMGRIKYVELPDAVKRNMMRLDSDNTFKYINLGAGLFKKSVFEKVGLFNEDFRFWEDLDWFLRAYENGISIKFIDQAAMIYRVHSDNMSNDRNQANHYFIKAVKNSINRRKNYTDKIKYNLLEN